MATIKINGVALEFNSFDADAVERAEKALEHVKSRSEEIRLDKSLKLSQGIRAVCNEVRECFNTVFSPGTDKKVFGDTCDMGKALDAFAQLTQQIVEYQKDGFTALTQKYMPNREARRAKK